MLQLLLFCGLIALLELDSTYGAQILHPLPLVAGALTGFLTGNLFAGLQIGAFTALIYMDFAPIGGVVPPSGAISAGLGVLMIHFFKVPVYLAFFAGVAGGVLFAQADRYARRLRAQVLRAAEPGIISGKISPLGLIVESLIFQFLLALAFMLVAITVGGPLAAAVNGAMTEKAHLAFSFAYFVVPWMGLAGLFLSFSIKPKSG